MTGPLSSRWRGFRAGVFAVVAALLAVGGHVIGGGEFPDAAALLSTTAVLGGSVSGLARRRRTASGIFGVLLVSQVAFHLTFVVTGHGHDSFDFSRMAAFHLVAAALAALVLARGESALFVLLSFLDRVLPSVPLDSPEPATGVSGIRSTRLDAARTGRPGGGSISRRGPPLPA